MKKLLTLLLVLFSATGFSQVLISGIYARGGSATSYYQQDYVELHNIGKTSVDLKGYTIQRRATGTGGFSLEYTFENSTVIPAGGYYLVASDAQAGINPIPTTPDAIAAGKLTLGAGGGTVALVKDATILTDCTTGCLTDNPNIADLVGWGNAKAYLGNAMGAFQSSASNVGQRKNHGCDNSNNNNNDFEQLDVSTDANPPRNSATTVFECNPSPVQLTSFSAQKSGSSVQLKWSTAQEQNSKEFVVERSADQSNWSAVTTVSAANNSNGANYAAEDHSPAQGANYYRLKIVDNDGSHAYSDIKSVVFSSSFAVSISPNPASTFINVTLSGSNGSSRVMVSDINGKIVYNELTTAPKLQINTSNFARGMYIVKVINGNEILTNKVIVQ